MNTLHWSHWSNSWPVHEAISPETTPNYTCYMFTWVWNCSSLSVEDQITDWDRSRIIPHDHVRCSCSDVTSCCILIHFPQRACYRLWYYGMQTSFSLNVFNTTTSSRHTPNEASLHVSSHLCHMACFLLREQEQHFLFLSAGRAHINRQTTERKQADTRLSACSEEQSVLKSTVQTNC